MELTLFSTLICRFFIGGIILSGSTYLANYSNPLLAGILVTIPLELVSLFFIKEESGNLSSIHPRIPVELVFGFFAILCSSFGVFTN